MNQDIHRNDTEYHDDLLSKESSTKIFITNQSNSTAKIYSTRKVLGNQKGVYSTSKDSNQVKINPLEEKYNPRVQEIDL